MNLENYISQLLYRYQCVTIPGFGAFLTEIQSSQLNESTNSFSPPKKLVSFNALLKNNDGLLANHIVKSEKSTYESALNYINFEVENWNAKLQEFGQFSIKNVGDFYLNNENKIVFEPINQLNYLTNSFGLSDFKSPVMERIETEIDTIKIITLETAQPLEIKEETPIIELKKERKYNNPYLKYAAILLIVAGVEAKYIIQLNNETIAEQSLVLEKKVQSQIYDKIQSATFEIANPLEKIVQAAPKKLNYHLVANAFHSKENADKACAKLKTEGYNAKVLPLNTDGTYKVIYQSYATFDDAKVGETKIEKKNNPDAWILIQKLK